MIPPQAHQNEEKRAHAARRLAAAYAANLALLQQKRDAFHAREAASEARRAKKEHEQLELETRKQQLASSKAMKRKVSTCLELWPHKGFTQLPVVCRQFTLKL